MQRHIDITRGSPHEGIQRTQERGGRSPVSSRRGRAEGLFVIKGGKSSMGRGSKFPQIGLAPHFQGMVFAESEQKGKAAWVAITQQGR